MKEQFLYCEMSKVTYRKNELTVPYLYYKDEKGEEYPLNIKNKNSKETKASYVLKRRP